MIKRKLGEAQRNHIISGLEENKEFQMPVQAFLPHLQSTRGHSLLRWRINGIKTNTLQAWFIALLYHMIQSHLAFLTLSFFHQQNQKTPIISQVDVEYKKRKMCTKTLF